MTKQEQAELGQQALRAFERELPQLWEERPGQWVAYQGERRLGFAAQHHEIYQHCFDQGLTLDEFVVFCIEPLETEIIFGVDAGPRESPSTPRGQPSVHLVDVERLGVERAVEPIRELVPEGFPRR